MHTTYNDVYYGVKVQVNKNLAIISPTQLTIKNKIQKYILKGAEVPYITNKRSTRTLK